MTEPLSLTLPEAVSELGTAFNVKYLRTQLLPGGLFHGLGYRKGGKPTGQWIVPRANLPEFIERHAIADTEVQNLDPVAPALPSGASPRSRRLRQMRESA